MKTPTIPDAQLIDVDSIKVFVSRAREKEGFDGIVSTIRGVGLKKPIEVRDISGRSAAARRRPDGGLYRYELTKGQGRLEACRKLGLKKIPAYVMNVAEADIPGRFLAENMIRRPQSWLEKARLVKCEFDAGATPEQVAKLLFIEPKHATRLHRIITRTTGDIEEDVGKLSVGEAEVLTTLPPEGQAIVLETMRDTGERQVRSLVNKAREVMEETGGKLSKTALSASLKRIDEDLRRVREKLKVMRLHDALGPVNVISLFEDAKFRAAAIEEGVNVEKFEKLIAQ